MTEARELLAQPLPAVWPVLDLPAPWQVDAGGRLLWDAAGRAAVAAALAAYRGTAARLELGLRLAPAAWADYYSLHRDSSPEWTALGVTAVREGSGSERLAIELPCAITHVPFPPALAPAADHHLPLALLMPVEHDVHLLFANHIALAAHIAARARRSPLAVLRALVARRPVPFAQRVGLAFREVHPTADVHPTAVVEGSMIGPGCRIGAHCTVRFSVLGAGVRLHDGAIAEWSVVGDRTWLMHGLALYRTIVERDCFLIHGPYQFSAFHAGSSAFATILMDYRPDGRPIRMVFPEGVRSYAGRFLGAILRPGARTLGGSLIAPGRIVERDQWLGVPEGSVHVRDQPAGAPAGRALPPGPFPSAASAPSSGP